MENYADIVKLHYKYYNSKQKPRLRGSPQKQLDTSYKKHIPSNLKELDKYSDIDSMVFENNNNNELIVAMRGLDFFRSPRDAMIGAEIALEDTYQQGGSDFETSTAKKKGISLLKNQYGEILIKEQKKIEDLKKEYPNKNIVLAGHSRGGRKAIDLGEHNDLEYHAFQPAEMNRATTPFLTMGTNIQSDSYGRSFGKLAEKILIPEVVKRSVADPYVMFREPSAVYDPDLISSEVIDAQEQIELGYKISSLPKEDKRQVSSKNSNIYKTSRDFVSRGYQHTQLVKPKQYAYKFYDYAMGDHSIDHFISKEMFDSINENKPLEIIENEIKEEVEINSLEPVISPPSLTQPSSTIGYTVNNRELCKKYGSVYSSHCNKLLR